MSSKQHLAIRANKNLGQNFLIDENIIRKIASHVSAGTKLVVEVGSGLGALTRQIAPRAESMIAYEIDSRLFTALQGEAALLGVKFVNEDFLEADFSWEGKALLVGNLPYYITTDILFKIFENVTYFSGALIMVQKEFGDRMLAKVGAPNYSKLAVSTAFFADVTKILDVPSTVFVPRPKVDSIVLSLKFKSPKLPEAPFLEFVKKCFAQRRKTLLNNLRNFIDHSLAEQLLISLGKGPSVRPQELSLSDYTHLFTAITKAHGDHV